MGLPALLEFAFQWEKANKYINKIIPENAKYQEVNKKGLI